MSNDDPSIDEAIDNSTLRDAILSAVMDWCAANGGGFPISFVCALDHVSASGQSTLTVTQMDSQPTYRSMGLAAYLDAWYRDDAQADFQVLWGRAGGDDE